MGHLEGEGEIEWKLEGAKTTVDKELGEREKETEWKIVNAKL